VCPVSNSERPDAPTLGIEGIERASRIGSGGAGVVYRAWQPRLNREVAVKIVTSPMIEEQTRRRFDKESRALGALSSHPNIVTVHDSGETATGQPYVVMEYVSGGSLEGKRHSSAQVAAIGVALGSALEEAHRHPERILHRDIKPANVLLGPFETPLLADFGLALSTEVSRDVSSVGAVGTPAYMAPELFEGAEPTIATDVYAFGATLYSLAAGHSPFSADTPSYATLIKRVLMDEPEGLQAFDVQPELAAVIDACMAKNPADRPATMLDAARGLQDAERAAGIDPTPTFVSGVNPVAGGLEDTRSAPLGGRRTATERTGEGAVPEPVALGAGTDAVPPGRRSGFMRRPLLVGPVALLLIAALVGGVLAATRDGGAGDAAGAGPSTTASAVLGVAETPVASSTTTSTVSTAATNAVSTTRVPTTVATTSPPAPTTAAPLPPTAPAVTAPPVTAPPTTVAPTTQPPAPELLAGFDVSATTLRVGEPATFVDTSTGSPTVWQWDWGNGRRTTAQNTTYAWPAKGRYVVTLTASNATELNSAQLTITVLPQPPDVGIIGPELITAGERACCFEGRHTGEVTRGAWSTSFGPVNEPAYPTYPSQWVNVNSPGVYSITLTVENSLGERDSATFQFTAQ